MKPWLNTIQRKLSVKGREGIKVIVIVTVYRGTVWLSIDPPLTSEAILEPTHVDNLIKTLAQAVQEARDYKES